MKVVWTELALHTLEIAHGYVQQDNPTAALRLVRRVRRATEKLSQFPYIGRVGIRIGTRELIVSDLPYIVVHRIKDSEIQIIRVFHQKQMTNGSGNDTARERVLHGDV
jgi:plasmid stabilization system protein ParE